MNNFTSKQFRLKSDKDIGKTIEILRELFEYENLIFQISENSIYTQKTPLPLMSYDRRSYSRRNWVGINPFVFVSGVKILIESNQANLCDLTVVLDKKRSYAIFIALSSCWLWASVGVPNGYWGDIIFCFISALAALLVLHLLPYRLIKSEINNALNS